MDHDTTYSYFFAILWRRRAFVFKIREIHILFKKKMRYKILANGFHRNRYAIITKNIDKIVYGIELYTGDIQFNNKAGLNQFPF